MKTVEELQAELEVAQNLEKENAKQAVALKQNELRKTREDLQSKAKTMLDFAMREAQSGNVSEAKIYKDLAENAEREAKNIILDGEQIETIVETSPDDLLTDYRQNSTRSNIYYFTGITLLFSLIYLRFGVWIKSNYPDAGIHDWATIHKMFSVVFFLFMIEISVLAMAALKDNYLYRYADTKKYFTLDIIKDFYETSNTNRLWLRFGYFALRFLGAVLLASGNLI